MVKRQGALDAIVFEKGLAADNFLDDFDGKIVAREEQAELSLVERGIVEEGEEHAWIGMVEEDGEFFADCG